MECPSCGHVNRAGARFCDSCGTPLGSAPAVRPPARLAEKVRAGRGALEGERKQVTLSEHTAALSRATSSSLTWGFEVKGVTRPLRVYELAGVGTAHGRLDVSRARGFSRFVGRDAELRALEDAQARGGRVVGIVGEPGVGKSRLTHES